ncbi:MAG: four helix bundle protein [Acidobacteria bacterium]|nr:four helix bundle protein [Acidobacteriota bacterium]
MSEKASSYKDLIVWQKSIQLVKQIYSLTRTFPADGRYGLVSQMRRAAVSIPSHIAEGQARGTTPDFIRFISNSEGSVAELETQLILSIELEYCSRDSAQQNFELLDEIRRMLNALRRTLSSKGDRSS